MRRFVVLLVLGACGRIDFDPLEGECVTAARIAGAPYATAEQPYLICTVDQLDQIGRRPEDWASSFVLGRDLDLAALPGEVTMIGDATTPFTGTFDGAGYTIANLRLDHPTQSRIGLIRSAGPAEIRNLTLRDVVITGLDYVGALVAETGTDILVEDITVSGELHGGRYVGGVVGYADCRVVACAGQLFQRIHAGPITLVGTTLVGGIAGGNYSGTVPPLFSDVSSDGSIDADSYAGGILGDGEAFTLERGRSSMSITANEYAGGLVGSTAYTSRSTLVDSVATGNVRCLGGACGGAVGYLEGTATRVQAHGDVWCDEEGCGGVMGYTLGGCDQCVATGDVRGLDSIGGLIGAAYSDAQRSIRDSYATGAVTGRNRVGGLVGEASATVVRSYSSSVVVGASEVGGALGRQEPLADPAALDDSFAAGNVTGTAAVTTVSALVGVVVGGGTITNSVYAGTCTDPGSTCTQNGTQAALPALYSPATPPLTTWDFTNIWLARSDGFPLLRAVPVP